MRLLLHALVIAALSMSLTACGNKGKLKSPSQIEEHEAKKKEKAEKQPVNPEKTPSADKEAVPSAPPLLSPAGKE
jgi:predicted small lipoprotein YifL